VARKTKTSVTVGVAVEVIGVEEPDVEPEEDAASELDVDAASELDVADEPFEAAGAGVGVGAVPLPAVLFPLALAAELCVAAAEPEEDAASELDVDAASELDVADEPFEAAGAGVGVGAVPLPAVLFSLALLAFAVLAFTLRLADSATPPPGGRNGP